MILECGQEILLRDAWGANAARYVAQCHGRFLVIGNAWERGNGIMLMDWGYVVRELVAHTVPAELHEKIFTVISMPGGKYVSFDLTWPLPAAELARLFGVAVDDMRDALAGFAMEEGGTFR